MKNSTLKFLLTSLLGLLIFQVKAQDLQTCKTSNNFTVDTNPTLGSGDETTTGSPGSTYTWTTSNGNLTQINPNSNQASIDWTGVAVGTTVTVTVIETNASNCESAPVTFTVLITAGPSAPTVTPNGPICEGDDAVFTITGTPGNVVTYNFDGGASQTIAIEADGSTDIIVPNVTASTTINVTAVASDATADACTTTVTVNATVTVNPLPKTSPIQAS